MSAVSQIPDFTSANIKIFEVKSETESATIFETYNCSVRIGLYFGEPKSFCIMSDDSRLQLKFSGCIDKNNFGTLIDVKVNGKKYDPNTIYCYIYPIAACIMCIKSTTDVYVHHVQL